jgi:hypothetical protein
MEYVSLLHRRMEAEGRARHGEVAVVRDAPWSAKAKGVLRGFQVADIKTSKMFGASTMDCEGRQHMVHPRCISQTCCHRTVSALHGIFKISPSNLDVFVMVIKTVKRYAPLLGDRKSHVVQLDSSRGFSDRRCPRPLQDCASEMISVIRCLEVYV